MEQSSDEDLDHGVTSDIGRFAIVPLWLVQRCNEVPSGSAALSVFITLHHWTDRSRPCFPSIASIAERAGLSPASVKRGMAALVKLGALSITHRYVEGSRERTSSSYRMHHADPGGRLGSDPTSAHIRPDMSGQIQSHPSAHIRASNKNKLEVEQVELEILRPVVHLSEFVHFWNGYPRKVGKPGAEKAWQRLKPGDQRSALDALGIHVAHWQATNTDTKFIPHPATWLNGRRWEDVLAAPEPNLSPAMRTIRARLIEAERRTRELGR